MAQHDISNTIQAHNTLYTHYKDDSSTIHSNTMTPNSTLLPTSKMAPAVCVTTEDPTEAAAASMKPVTETTVTLTLPDWLAEKLALNAKDGHITSHYQNFMTDEARMQLAIDLSRENIQQNTGGPFGCAIYRKCTIKDQNNTVTCTYTLASVGVNRVVNLNNSTLHGEVVAIQLAQKAIGCFTLSSSSSSNNNNNNNDDCPVPVVEYSYEYELYTSCEPCAMCLGATLWSGVSRLVCGATKADAGAIGFDEGPVFEASYQHLKSAGIVVKKNVLGDAAAEVLNEYGQIGAVIYNR